MDLPLKPPVEPQLARSKKELPEGEEWSYEPKFDGFRAIVFVDGDEVLIQSRGAKPLDRYFPELAFPGGRYIVDGEIIIDSDSDGAAGLRRPPAAHPSRRVADRHARRGDPGPVRGLRRAGHRR